MIFGYLAAALIGVSLGLIGGGGSILTVPVLVYLFGITPGQATSYSLFVVGGTSLVGAIGSYRKKQVDIKTALLFGMPSIITVFITRKYIMPSIPGQWLNIGSFVVTKSFAVMVLFAILMLLASVSMIRGGKETGDTAAVNTRYYKLLLYGIGIGLVTGVLGAGGGFLLIPALVIAVKLPVKTAVGTSLLIIALNSLVGFTGDLGHYAVDWTFLLTIVMIAVLGVIAGGRLSGIIAAGKLKAAFGWFVLIMGFYILIREIFIK